MAQLFSVHRPICQAAACRKPAMQQQHAAHRVAFARSAYFGQTLRPQVAKGLQLPSSRRGKQQLQVQASFFGVGAPEAILVGVVALLVFGPKGLAQAAKSLGQTLRAFQPTIRELTQVSAELKSSLETEIGINEIKEELRRPLDPPAPTPAAAAATVGGEKQGKDLTELANEMTAKVKDIREDMAKAVDPEIEAKRAESAKLAWGAGAGAAGAGPAGAAAPAAEPVVRPAAAPAASLDNLSLEQLEAELQRRKAAAAAAAKGGAVPKELRADE